MIHRGVEVRAFEQKSVVEVLRTNDVNLLAEEVMVHWGIVMDDVLWNCSPTWEMGKPRRSLSVISFRFFYC